MVSVTSSGVPETPASGSNQAESRKRSFSATWPARVSSSRSTGVASMSPISESRPVSIAPGRVAASVR